MPRKRRPQEPLNSTPSSRPAMTPEARENQLISMAYDLAERRIMEGTASDTMLTHFLKMGSTKERVEKEILERQKDLVTAKTEALQSARRVEELYGQAIEAMRRYSGQFGDGDEGV